MKNMLGEKCKLIDLKITMKEKKIHQKIPKKKMKQYKEWIIAWIGFLKILMEEIRWMEYFKKETHLRRIINISQKMFKEMRRIIIKEE